MSRFTVYFLVSLVLMWLALWSLSHWFLVALSVWVLVGLVWAEFGGGS